MNRILFLLLALLLAGGLRAQDAIDLADPFIGTGGHGHTFPGATLPFGMVQLSPDTRTAGWDACGGYHYSDSVILGFSHTHLSGTGVADYGDILVMPRAGGDGLDFRARFSHSSETAHPGYYAVTLEPQGIRAELTAARRAGIHRYTFPGGGDAQILIDLEHGLGPDNVLESSLRAIGDSEIVGLRRSSGWAKNQVLYFCARFSKPFSSLDLFSGEVRSAEGRTISGKDCRAIAHFRLRPGEQVMVKVALSSVGEEGARKNMDAEAAGFDFDRARSAAEKEWRAALGKIRVEGGTPDQRKIFYTALYHAQIAPNLFSDADGSYRGMDGEIHRADGFEMYTVFSLWDTFRALHPLLAIIDPARTRDFVRSLLAKSDEAKNLPVWELASNETWCMIGYHAVPVIVDAYMKGIRDFDAKKALEAMLRDAAKEERGLAFYRAFGFIPGDRESESVSKTLEYCYDDWCIAQFAAAIGETKTAGVFRERAQNYRNLFDPATGFMRPKINGGWLEPFDPAAVTMHYTEANAWQYSFFVPHAVNDLIALHGEEERFSAKLDSMFGAPPRLAGRDQADISGMIGQYAQGNEPSHHMAYLYDYAGAPWKTQQIVRRIMDSLYTAAPDGLCGNDDCGQMSAWFVMSALGIYPVNPGQSIYCIGSPLFPLAAIAMEKGATFTIRAKNISKKNFYIQSATLDGISFTRSFLRHEELAKGGALSFDMGSSPARGWGSSPADRPSSPALAPLLLPVPAISAPAKVFAESEQVAIASPEPGAEIRYTTDGSEPTRSSKVYVSPIPIGKSTTIRAFARSDDGRRSKTVGAEFIRHRPVGKITLTHPPSPQYNGGSDQALVDGIRGEKDFRLGAWQGFEQVDLDAVVDLGEEKTITEVSLGCLQDPDSWIFFPMQVEFSFSNNYYDYGDGYLVPNKISSKESGPVIHEFGAQTRPTRARYVRVTARNMGFCPPWHRGAGGKAWIFADEFTIKTK